MDPDKHRPSSAYNSQFWTTNSGAPVWNNNSSLTVGHRDWKIMNSWTFGIANRSISFPALKILKTLQSYGFGAYLVGGCVRDLLLKRTPKDFDVITTASLKQVKKLLRHRCFIIGRRIPICQVYISSSMVEVSSFETPDANGNGREAIVLPHMQYNYSKKDVACWKNCMKRDFTINSLFFDPFECKIYDYVGGIKDLKACKVRTVIPPHLSFKEDCARILRGIRIAARLGLQFSKETRTAMQDLSSSILTLDKARLMMEMNFMLAYGASVPSIHLLQKFKLFELLFPVQAAYLANQSKNLSVEKSFMLMKLFSTADKLLAADRPCCCSLWMGLLAFHLALVDYPQDAFVVWTFSSILYHGTWNIALESAKLSSDDLIQFVPEILQTSVGKTDELLFEETFKLASLVKSSIRVLSDSSVLQQSLAKYTSVLPSQALVLASQKMTMRVSKIFDVMPNINRNSYSNEMEASSVAKKGPKFEIDYEKLKKGDMCETRFVLGKIIMDTMRKESINEPDMISELERKQGNHVRLSSLF
ncbi:Catalase [Apostasia shenzhenica]|uniref:Catalase n=1 Tax=Apostasia shenzhenica TaxID=1088818 RepID=A0A2H9ZWS5_9ASPA|nr:Catalase [Apostasia shenzhenica]